MPTIFEIREVSTAENQCWALRRREEPTEGLISARDDHVRANALRGP
jgi:hypothetical protein